MFAGERNFRFVMDLAREGDFGLLLGSVEFNPPTEEDYNTAVLLTGRGTGHQSYRKMHLVPSSANICHSRGQSSDVFLGQLVPGDFTPGAAEYTAPAPARAPRPTSPR